MPNQPFPYTLATLTDRRLIRVGAAIVLEVTVTYPRLAPADGEETPALLRFNETYSRIAEAFLGWGTGNPASEATQAFRAMGSGAAYRFDRRLLCCTMVAELPQEAEESPYLTVTRTVISASRRDVAGGRSLAATDLWRLPSLTLCPPRPRPRPRQTAHEGAR